MFIEVGWRDLRGVLTVLVLPGILCTCKTVVTPPEEQDPICALDPGPLLDFGAPLVGTIADLTLEIRNQNTEEGGANEFHYDLLIPVTNENCSDFSLPYGGTSGRLGPGETKQIVFRFGPHAARPYSCEVRLNTLEMSNGHATTHPIENSCSSPLTLSGFGYPKWESCMGDGNFDALRAVHSGLGSVVAVGEGGTVLRKGTGCSWTAMDLAPIQGSTLSLQGVWGFGDPLLNDYVLWAVGNRPPPPGFFGDHGAVIRYDESGWSQPSEGTFFTYGSVWGSGLDDAWFVGQGIASDFPNAQHWDGLGLEGVMIDWGWTKLTGVHGASGEDVWAVVSDPFHSVFHFDGSSWEDRTQAFMNQPLHDVWTTSNGHVYAVGADGAIYHNDRGTWVDETVAHESRDLYGVWADAETGFAVAVGEYGVIYHLDGSEWTRQSLSHLDVDVRNLHDVFGIGDDQGVQVWAVGEEEGGGGVILRLAFLPSS